MAHGNKVFLVWSSSTSATSQTPIDGESTVAKLECVVMSVSAMQDVLRIFQDAGKNAWIETRDINAYNDPTTGHETRYIDPDTARKMAKLAAK